MAPGQQRKPGAAEAAFRKAIDLKPDLALGYFNLSRAWAEQDQFDEAQGAKEDKSAKGDDFDKIDASQLCSARFVPPCPRRLDLLIRHFSRLFLRVWHESSCIRECVD